MRIDSDKGKSKITIMLLFSIVLIFNYLLSFAQPIFTQTNFYRGIQTVTTVHHTMGIKCQINPDTAGLPSRILRMPELSQLLGISRSTIYEKMNPLSKYYDATFPGPVRLGSGSVGCVHQLLTNGLLYILYLRISGKGVNDEVRHTLSSDMTMSR